MIWISIYQSLFSSKLSSSFFDYEMMNVVNQWQDATVNLVKGVEIKNHGTVKYHVHDTVWHHDESKYFRNHRSRWRSRIKGWRRSWIKGTRTGEITGRRRSKKQKNSGDHEKRDGDAQLTWDDVDKEAMDGEYQETCNSFSYLAGMSPYISLKIKKRHYEHHMIEAHKYLITWISDDIF